MSHEPPEPDSDTRDDLERLRPIDQQFYGRGDDEMRRSKTGVLRVTSSSLKIPEGFVVERGNTQKLPQSLTLNKIALGVLVLFLAFIGFVAWMIFEMG